mmetsp:Transcript_21278/g.61929  ORF Transcript_21278/g.61929 Transcript_21278/m.61929 type:complete len:242 (-) Transcript_21278:292-1017(-)
MNLGPLLCVLHAITMLLPQAGTTLFACVLFFAWKNSGMAISELTISSAFAAYPDYKQLLLAMIAASSLMFVATIVRNIQVRIWYRRRFGNYLQVLLRGSKENDARDQSATRLAMFNDVASVVNILAYIAFLVLAVVRTGDMDPIHRIATVCYFTLSSIYAIMQTVLTTTQGDHYPRFVAIAQIFLVVMILLGAVGCAVTFFYLDSPRYELEWLAVVCNLIFVFFFSVMFHIDSAADELIEF